MISLRQELNKSQQEAVETTEGRIRVVAGAGSGKTRVIAHRYAYLVNELGIDPANILCTTFTNKAAREMTSRISKLVNSGHYNDFVCTIHGFCVKFLRKEIFRIGFPSSFTIIDTEDSKSIGKEVMEGIGEKTSVKTIQRFLDENIYQQKQRLQEEYVEKFLDQEHKLSQEERQTPFGIYLQKQLKLFALDFHDLIYTTLYILEKSDEARESWSDRLNYIMVDEAQDCSTPQWKLIEMLASSNNNLLIVGDPDQAIYEWRGAKPELFVDFANDTTVILNENYRSTPNILNVANSIISNNENRVKKDLYTNKQSAAMTVHYHGKNEREESEWIVMQIKNLLKNTGAKLSDFAILFRASYLSRAVEQALIREGVQYTIWGGFRFFERKEIKDVLAYLRLINSGDDLSFQRILNVPSRKLGKTYLSKIKELAATEQSSLYETLKKHVSDKDLGKKTAKDFVDFIEECRKLRHSMNLSDFVNYAIENSGLKAEIRESGDEERLDNLAELATSIKLYEEENAESDLTLGKYLQDIALYTNADYKKDAESVKLMTIHQSKGLEFPYVFIIGLSEGILPSYHSIRERKKRGIEEERRLLYVAITRAEKGLFITESEGYLGTISMQKYPSRFIQEIKKDWIVTENEIPEELWEGTRQLVSQNQEDDYDDMERCAFSIGDIVEHKIFGTGTIIASVNDGTSYQVQFEKGKRIIRESFLTKV